ncbi:embryonic polarity protein dorsal-like [Rhagoletis pomonella]|uniref:embryonic polarity protein dorsal-like n=1 Tax=Rhagoletis pomonella TaxID=28610 RepID=UPI00177F0A6E|nr:embryonic polarity protein dorsal-like [Rhagoletis pomonella]
MDHRQQQQQQQHINFNVIPTEQQQQQPTLTTNLNSNVDRKFATAYVRVVEQPASKALRFRYECEGRSAGSIPGAHSTPEKKTYPTIEIVGYQGRAVVVVSCVTKDAPYRPHPHNLAGKEGCKSGVCTLEIKSDSMRLELNSLGIQCVKKKDIEAALKAREDIRVDPFKTGFAHRFQPGAINLNAVRLCFQVFIEGEKGRFTVPLKPVVSEPIYDKKSKLDLVIHQVCSSATVLGNTQIMLLCEKVAKEDIAVRFFEERNGVTVWQAYGEFHPSDVHKQTSIRLKTPRYRNVDITEPVKLFVQLKRPSDGAVSEPWVFKYEPVDSNPVILRRKCQRIGLRPIEQQPQQQQKQAGDARLTNWNIPNLPEIKADIKEDQRSPNINRGAAELTPSPEPLLPVLNNLNQSNLPAAYKPIFPPVPNQCQRTAVAGRGGGGGDPSNAELTPITVEKHNENGAYGGSQQQQHPQQLRPPAPNYATHPLRQQQTLPEQPPSDQRQQHYRQQQQQQQQQQLQQQKQYFQENLLNNPNVGVWEEQFANVLAFAAAAMSNFNGGSNQFNMQNLLAATAPSAMQHSQWNFPFNHVPQRTQNYQQHLQLQQPTQSQQPQQQPHQPLQSSFAQQPNAGDDVTMMATADVNNAGAVGGGSGGGGGVGSCERGATISNLLNLDSDQLVRVNQEEQQMFRLTNEELQLSNLTISV